MRDGDGDDPAAALLAGGAGASLIAVLASLTAHLDRSNSRFAQAAGMLTAAVGPGVGARFSALSPDWMLRDISAFDPRDIELPKGNGTEAEEEEEVTGLAALAKLLPPGSALQKCLAGAAGQQGGYNGLGV